MRLVGRPKGSLKLGVLARCCINLMLIAKGGDTEKVKLSLPTTHNAHERAAEDDPVPPDLATSGSEGEEEVPMRLVAVY
jgi:hypothetical protein